MREIEKKKCFMGLGVFFFFFDLIRDEWELERKVNVNDVRSERNTRGSNVVEMCN